MLEIRGLRWEVRVPPNSFLRRREGVVTVLHSHLQIGDGLLLQVTLRLPVTLPTAEVAVKVLRPLLDMILLRAILQTRVSGSVQRPESLRFTVPSVMMRLGRISSAPAPLILVLIASSSPTDERRRSPTIARLDPIVVAGGKLSSWLTGWSCGWHRKFRFGDGGKGD